MKVIIVTEVDLDTGRYEVTFRNKSEPGMPMELNTIKKAWLKVAKDFNGDRAEESLKDVLLA